MSNRKLTSMQVTALKRLAEKNSHLGPVSSEAIRCREVHYAGDILSRLVKRTLVSMTGRGPDSLYEITEAGKAKLARLS